MVFGESFLLINVGGYGKFWSKIELVAFGYILVFKRKLQYSEKMMLFGIV